MTGRPTSPRSRCPRRRRSPTCRRRRSVSGVRLRLPPRRPPRGPGQRPPRGRAPAGRGLGRGAGVGRGAAAGGGAGRRRRWPSTGARRAGRRGGPARRRSRAAGSRPRWRCVCRGAAGAARGDGAVADPEPAGAAVALGRRVVGRGAVPPGSDGGVGLAARSALAGVGRRRDALDPGVDAEHVDQGLAHEVGVRAVPEGVGDADGGDAEHHLGAVVVVDGGVLGQQGPRRALVLEDPAEDVRPGPPDGRASSPPTLRDPSAERLRRQPRRRLPGRAASASSRLGATGSAARARVRPARRRQRRLGRRLARLGAAGSAPARAAGWRRGRGRREPGAARRQAGAAAAGGAGARRARPWRLAPRPAGRRRHALDVEATLEAVEPRGIPTLAGGGRAAGRARRSARAGGGARWRRSSR